MPTRNRSEYLKTCLRSLLKQSYADIEVVISDNGSTDNTEEVVASFAEQDRRVIYVKNTVDRGMAANWLAAMKRATGDYLALVNDDDWCSSDFVQVLLNALEEHPTAALAFGNMQVVRADGSRDPEWDQDRVMGSTRSTLREGVVADLLRAHVFGRQLTFVTSLFKTDALRQMGFLDVESGTMVDYDAFVRLGQGGATAVFVNQPVAFYRIHGGQQTILRSNSFRVLENNDSMYRVLRKYKFEDRDLEIFRRRRVSWIAAWLANRLSSAHDPRTWNLIMCSLSYGPRSTDTCARLIMAALKYGWSTWGRAQ